MSTATQQVAPERGDGTPTGLDDIAHRVEEALSSVLIRKPQQVKIVTAAIITGSHVLLHDLPGVGKTTLATAAARAIGGEFRRIQGGPDLLPTDLTGAVVLDQGTGEWRFRPGPLLANVVLVDEINRISPRTQSALLQVMAERKISVEGVVRSLPDPYIVIATMNPSGSAGTFAMASGQLDRFDVTVELGSVDRQGERELLRSSAGPDLAARVEAVLPVTSWAAVREAVAAVHVADSVLDYVLDLCAAARRHGHISVRGSRSMVRMAQGLAVLEGRSFIVPDDIKSLVGPCLSHRLLTQEAPLSELTERVQRSVEEVAAPIHGG